MRNLFCATIALLCAAAPVFAAAQGRGERRSEWTILVVDGEGEYKIEGRDGRISAWINGEPVDEGRIARHGDRIQILGEDGGTLREFLAPGQHGAQRLELRALGGPEEGQVMILQQPGEGGAEEQHQAIVVEPFQEMTPSGERRPRIGITMGQMDEGLAAHLGLDRGKVVVITGVEPDLPAARAGVRKFDVVVAVDGKSPVSEESLRDAVLAKKVGDTIVLRVRRGDATLDIPVPIALAPDTRAFSLGLGAGDDDNAAFFDATRLLGDFEVLAGRRLEEARRHIERAQAELREQLEHLKHEDLRAPLEAVREALEHAGEALKDRFEGWSRDLRVLTAPYGEGRNYLFKAPAPPKLPEPPKLAPRPDLDERLRRLEERLGRIEEMLDRLERD